MIQNKIIQKIKITLNKIRPFIQRDGGDVEFVSFENGVVYIQMTGACKDCAFVDQTIKNSIEVILLEEIPEIKSVKLKK